METANKGYRGINDQKQNDNKNKHWYPDGIKGRKNTNGQTSWPIPTRSGHPPTTQYQFDEEWFWIQWTIYYIQVKGTAMGKRFAPAYANIYIDDIWGIWTNSEEEFQEFTQTLNSHHPSINIKPLTSSTTMDFLDVTIFKGPEFNTTGQLDTKGFFKPTDSHALLNYSSFHPKHTFGGITKSQFIRFGRICSRPEDCTSATQTLFQALRRGGYPRSLLRTIRKNAHSTQTLLI